MPGRVRGPEAAIVPCAATADAGEIRRDDKPVCVRVLASRVSAGTSFGP